MTNQVAVQETDMRLGRCQTCRWWGPPAAFLRACSQPKFRVGYQFADAEVPSDGMRVENDEGWGFVTGPDFGCVHWEEDAPGGHSPAGVVREDMTR